MALRRKLESDSESASDEEDFTGSSSDDDEAEQRSIGRPSTATDSARTGSEPNGKAKGEPWAQANPLCLICLPG